ncbi:MAG: glycosyltransferase [Cytophagales bacterium]
MSAEVFEKISPVIIVKNGAKHLFKCLNSLKAFKEVVMVDNESDDNTLEIAKQFQNVVIFSSPFLGFGPLKNLAVSKSTNDWVLIIDSDEVLSEELIQNLKKIDLSDINQVFELKRLNHYRQRPIKACGWENDWQQRIFNRSKHQFLPVQVHETLNIIDELSIIKKIEGNLLHYPFDSIKSLLAKMDQYAELYAKQKTKSKNIYPLVAVFKAFFTFFRDYFLLKGFVYGFDGFIISVCNANGTLYKYLKLIEFNRSLPVSLAITTFNRHDALNAVLKSVEKQTIKPVEVIIADDGSGDETLRLIEEWRLKASINIVHVWHDDLGFRAAKIRNEAIKVAQSPYLVFIDGDMVLHKKFIEDHIRFARRGVWVQGSRVLVNAKKTAQIIQNYETGLNWFQKGIKNRLNAMRMPLFSQLFFLKSRKDLESTKTCNLAFWKDDAYLVNGFDEDFIGWGREDSEFVARLMHSGIKRKDLKFSALAFHLEHPYNSRASLPENDERLNQTVTSKKRICSNGLVK